MEKLLVKNAETPKVKVVLKCGRNAEPIYAGYAGDGCGGCDANTNNSGQAVCC